MIRRIFLSIMFLALLITVAHAVQPDEMLSDPALEARARAIGKELRCLVCQNESVDDSNADLAHDLRVLVRERLSAGDSDQQVRQYIVDRYGQYVLLRPPFERSTFILWLGGPITLIAGIWGTIFFYRRRSAIAAPLTPEEHLKIDRLLKEAEDHTP